MREKRMKTIDEVKSIFTLPVQETVLVYFIVCEVKLNEKCVRRIKAANVWL